MGVNEYISLYLLGKKKADRKIEAKGNVSVSVTFAFLSRQLIYLRRGYPLITLILFYVYSKDQGSLMMIKMPMTVER